MLEQLRGAVLARDLDGEDLAVEVPGLRGLRGPGVRARGEVVGLLAGQPPLGGDEIAADALRDQLALVAHRHHGPERVLAVRRGAHGDAGHVLDAGGNDEVVGAGDHALRREVDGLLRGAALPVDGCRRDLLGKPGGEPRVPADVDGLLPDLRDTARDVVLDQPRVDAGPLHERLEHGAQQVDRMGAGEAALALPDGAPDCLDDDGLTHGPSPSGCFRFNTYRTVTYPVARIFPQVSGPKRSARWATWRP